MYTVFYGFIYGVMLCVLFGMISSMSQLFSAAGSTAAQELPYATPVTPFSYGQPYGSPPAAGSMR
jgi:hypothetical protein